MKRALELGVMVVVVVGGREEEASTSTRVMTDLFHSSCPLRLLTSIHQALSSTFKACSLHSLPPFWLQHCLFSAASSGLPF